MAFGKENASNKHLQDIECKLIYFIVFFRPDDPKTVSSIP
jgi:hypothetical protein